MVLKVAPSRQKRKHLPYVNMKIVVALTRKGKVVHMKPVWIG